MELADIKPGHVWRIQYQAMVRMLLFITGQTHEMLNTLAGDASKAIVQAAGEAGTLDGLGYYQAQSNIEGLWSETFKEWKRQFEVLRSEAVAIAFGGLCALHERFVRPALPVLESAGARAGLFQEAMVIDYVFQPQMQAVLDAAGRRIYTDGIPLSSRIWKLDRNTREGIKQALAEGLASSRSAWNIAKNLQSYLGGGADCPRWTSTRLRLTKKEIAAGDLRGLKSGEECRGQGVAYNALRLARNELQIAHAMATDSIMQRLPFVEKEQIKLSPSHPQDDECDAVIAGGENGAGIYPKGTIGLPIHVQCLCFKTAVLQKPDEFAGQLHGWMDGTQPWPAMDVYTGMIGGGVGSDLSGASALMSLLRWAGGTYGEMGGVVR